MSLADLKTATMAVHDLMHHGLPLEWRAIPDTVTDPVAAAAQSDWPIWENDQRMSLVKNGDNFLQATLVFPESWLNVPTEGDVGYLQINGYCPFTLWIDGVECFHETRPWHGTGPIADPVTYQIVPGQPIDLRLSLRPTELSANNNPLMIHPRSRHGMQRTIDLMALIAELELAEALAETPAEKDLVARAAAMLEPATIEAHDWPAIDAATERIEAALAPFAERARGVTMHLIGHSHIDMDWQWTWEDTVLCARRDLKAAVDILRDHPDVRFSLSQAPLYEVTREHDPAVFAAIREHVAAGRWENLAATWVEGDLNMAHGESIARHALYAALWSDEALGQRSHVMWEPDTFGHPGNMPQLARLSGCDTYFHWRCNPGGWQPHPARVWEGVDGSRILTLSSAYGGSLYPATGMHQALTNVLATIREGGRVSHHIWGYGDHGGGLSRLMLALLERWRHRPIMPTIRFSTVADYRDDLLAEGRELPSNMGETFHLFEGCFTTHVRHKFLNRSCEGSLLDAETLCALSGHDARAELRDAWKAVLFNQFHDLLDGAAVPDAYADAESKYYQAALAVKRVYGAHNAHRVAAPEERRAGRTVEVKNLQPFPRRSLSHLVTGVEPEDRWLLSPDGKRLPLQHLTTGQAIAWSDDIPAFSNRWYTISQDAEAPIPSPISVQETEAHLTIETSFARVTIDRRSGVIGSFIDKRDGREFVDYGVEKPLAHVPVTRLDLGLNVFTIQHEAPNSMSAWHINDILRTENLLRGATVELIDCGPVCARVRVHHSYGDSSIEQEIRFYADSPRVDFETTVDWQEIGGPDQGVPQLKCSFGTALSGTRARYAGPFVVTERPANGMETVTQDWAAISGSAGGFAVYNQGIYGCDALGSRLRLTLLRTAYGPDPRSDHGRWGFSFAFEPLPQDLSNAELSRRGRDYVECLYAQILRGEPPRLNPPAWGLTNPEIQISSYRLAERGEGRVLRLFDVNGEGASCELTGISQATAVNFIEEPIEDPGLELAGDRIRLKFRPFEVKTLLLPS